MENDQKITNAFFVILTIFFGINISTMTLTSLLMKDFQQSAWMIPLMNIIPLLILTFFYKPSNFKKMIEKNIFYKFLMLITLLINTSILIAITSIMMGHAFFKISSSGLFVVLISIVIIILSLGDFNKIVRLGIILVIGSLIFIPFFLDIEFTNQKYIDIIPNKIDFNILKGFYFSSIFSELFILTVFNDNYIKPISRRKIIFSGLIICILVTLQIIDSYTIVNYRYYLEIKILAFNRYFSHNGRRFFEHLDILLLYILLTTTFYKSTFNAIYLKNLFKTKHKILFSTLYFLLIITLCFIFVKNTKLLEPILYLTICLSIINTILIIYFSRRGKDVSKFNQPIKDI
ncbi:MAG: hypothetical protein IKC22_04660 [Bacilli bacterium]|nr:hypothetical protein [Bacilli bacterium]